jgi:hypothetical protein
MVHTIVEILQVQNMMGWARRLEIQGRVAIQVQWQSAGGILCFTRRSFFVLVRLSTDR